MTYQEYMRTFAIGRLLEKGPEGSNLTSDLFHALAAHEISKNKQPFHQVIAKTNAFMAILSEYYNEEQETPDTIDLDTAISLVTVLEMLRKALTDYLTLSDDSDISHQARQLAHSILTAVNEDLAVIQKLDPETVAGETVVDFYNRGQEYRSTMVLETGTLDRKEGTVHVNYLNRGRKQMGIFVEEQDPDEASRHPHQQPPRSHGDEGRPPLSSPRALVSCAAAHTLANELEVTNVQAVWKYTLTDRITFKEGVLLDQPGTDLRNPGVHLDKARNWARTEKKWALDRLSRVASGSELPLFPVALEQIKDIQVMDYLMGIPDRKMDQLQFQFDDHIPGSPKIVAVYAVDNTNAFSTLPPDQMDDHMLYGISSNMHSKLINTNEKQYRIMLQQMQLEPRQEQAAMARFLHMKSVLIRSAQFDEKNIPEYEDTLKKFNMGAPNVNPITELKALLTQQAASLPKPATNPYGLNLVDTKARQIIQDVPLLGKILRQLPQRIQSQPQQNEPLPKPKEAYVQARHEMDPQAIRTAFNRQHQILTRLSQRSKWDSQEYKNVMTCLENVLHGKGGAEQLRKDLNSLQEAAEHYAGQKPLMPRTQLGRDRLTAARELRSFCVGMQDRLTLSMQAQQFHEINDTFALTRYLNNRITQCQTAAKDCMARNESPLGPINEMLCLTLMKDNLKDSNLTLVRDNLSPESMQFHLQSIEPVVKGFLERKSSDELEQLLNGPRCVELILRSITDGDPQHSHTVTPPPNTPSATRDKPAPKTNDRANLHK